MIGGFRQGPGRQGLKHCLVIEDEGRANCARSLSRVLAGERLALTPEHLGHSIQSNQKKNLDCPESLRASGVVWVLSSERRVVRVVTRPWRRAASNLIVHFWHGARSSRGVVHAWRSGCFKREVTMIDCTRWFSRPCCDRAFGVGGRRRDRTRTKAAFCGPHLPWFSPCGRALADHCRKSSLPRQHSLFNPDQGQDIVLPTGYSVSVFKSGLTSHRHRLQGQSGRFEVYILESGHGLPSRCNDQSTFGSGDFDPTNPFTPDILVFDQDGNWSASWRSRRAPAVCSRKDPRSTSRSRTD